MGSTRVRWLRCTSVTVMAARVCVVGSVNADLTFTVDALPRPGQTVLASSLVVIAGWQGRQSGGGRRPRGRVGAARRRAGQRLPPPSNCVHTCAPTTSGSTAWSPCPGPAARRSIVVDCRGGEQHRGRAGCERAPERELGRYPRRHRRQRRGAVAAGDPDRHRHRRRTGRAGRRRDRHRQRVACRRATARPAGPVRTRRRRRRQRGRGTRMALAGTASRDHPGQRAAPATSATTNASTCPPRASTPVDTTGAGDVFAGVLAAAWRDGHEVALRRACAAGALSTLVPGAGDCAPYCRSHRRRSVQPKGNRGSSMTATGPTTTSTRVHPTATGWAPRTCGSPGKDRSASARWTGPRRATR